MTESRATVESPSVPLSSPNIIAYLGWGEASEAGPEVTPKAAFSLATCWACLACRAEAWSAFPFGVFRRNGRDRIEVRDHPLAELLRLKPNPASTSMSWRESMQFAVDGWGNGYSEIIYGPGGREIRALEQLPTDRITPVRSRTGELFYAVLRQPDDAAPDVLPARRVLHIAGPGWDGVRGMSLIELQRNTIGYALAARRLGSRLMKNDARPPAVITLPGRLQDDDTAEAIADRIAARHGGENFGRPIVLGSGASYQSVGLPPDQVQFIQTQEWGLAEICRIFRVPPHKIGHLKEAGDRANVEQENLRFAVDVQVPQSRRWEIEADWKLFSESERRAGFYVKVDLKGALRGDFKSRSEGYKLMRELGALNADEIRELEDEPPIGGRAGSVYLVPLNMADSSQEPRPPAPEPAPADEPDPAAGAADRERILGRLLPLFQDAEGRILGRLVERLGTGRQPAPAFWAEQRTRAERALAPAVGLLVADLAEQLAAELGRDVLPAAELERHARAVAADLAGSALAVRELDYQTARDAGADLRAVVAGWTERRRFADLARRALGNALRGLCRDLGASWIRWTGEPSGGACEACTALAGRSVPVDQPFDGGIWGPPVHFGCRCGLVPAL